MLAKVVILKALTQEKRRAPLILLIENRVAERQAIAHDFPAWHIA
jgi:hypothetical protein